MAGETGTAKKRSTEQRGMLRRRFRLLDAMILIGATAAGCGLNQRMKSMTESTISWPSLSELWDAFRQVRDCDSWLTARGVFFLGSSDFAVRKK
jgi:hypothetical protein